MGHVKAFMKDFVFDISRSLLQGNDVAFLRNLFVKCVSPLTSGPRVPVVNNVASSAQVIERKCIC